MEFQAHQGDVFIESIEAMPSGVEKLNTGVIAIGESSGHKHELTDGNYQLYKAWEAATAKYVMYLRVDSEYATLEHTGGDRPDHGPITIPKGDHKITLQQVYSPRRHEPVRVID